MESFDVSRLKRIVKNTLSMIDKSREAIYDIAEGARRECSSLEEELNQLKLEVEQIILQGEKLETELKKSRLKLASISKNFGKFNQEDIRSAYENADRIRIELAVNREREKFTIVRRNDLERRLKDAFGTVKKAESLVSQVGTVMDYLSGDLNHLNVHLEDTEKRKYLAVRIIKAQEEERSRVAREIHDGPAQLMSNVVLKAEICEKLIEVDLEQTRVELRNLKKIVRDSLKDVRRIIYDLKPMSLEDLGLIPTLYKYVENFSVESNIDIQFKDRGSDDISIDDKNLNLTVFRVVQEALNNIRKHSDAKTGDVRLEYTPKHIVIKITDKGRGFDTNLIKVEKDDGSGFGLFSMKERIELLNGTLEVTSKPGKGTVIKVVIPHNKE